MLFLGLITGSSTSAVADPLGGFGYSADFAAYAQAPVEKFVFRSTAIPFSDTAATTAVGGNGFPPGETAQSTISLSEGNGNIGLHGLSTAYSPANGGGTIADFSMFWYDTYTLSGSGLQPYNFVLSLDATGALIGETGRGDDAYGVAQLYENYLPAFSLTSGEPVLDPACGGTFGSIAGNPCRQIASIGLDAAEGHPNGGSVSGTIWLEGGTSVEIGVYLAGAAGVRNGFTGTADDEARFDASDTAFLTLTPERPDESFTSASGLIYAGDPDGGTVPEPGSLALFCSALAGLALIRPRKRKTV